MTDPKTCWLPPDEIEATGATQVRVRISPELVQDYQEALSNGAIFPPIICFAEEGSERYILADGFHRLQAHLNFGAEAIQVEMHDGGVGEALDYALSANEGHGARRTSADKRHAVQMALKDPRHKDRSIRDIADLCRVSKSLVHDIKQEQNKDKRQVSEKDSKGNKEPAAGNERQTREPPSQEEIDKAELMEACGVINRFPYSGAEAIDRMGLGPDEYQTLNNAADWLDGALAPMGTEGFDGED